MCDAVKKDIMKAECQTPGVNVDVLHVRDYYNNCSMLHGVQWAFWLIVPLYWDNYKRKQPDKVPSAVLLLFLQEANNELFEQAAFHHTCSLVVHVFDVPQEREHLVQVLWQSRFWETRRYAVRVSYGESHVLMAYGSFVSSKTVLFQWCFVHNYKPTMKFNWISPHGFLIVFMDASQVAAGCIPWDWAHSVWIVFAMRNSLDSLFVCIVSRSFCSDLQSLASRIVRKLSQSADCWFCLQ